MSEPGTVSPPRVGTGQPSKRGTLTVILLCQLMVGVDSTILTVALPRLREGLGFSATGLSWVPNSYMLAVGSLLLLGGRAGDTFGRRRVFVAGVAVFTTFSLLGGLAPSPAWLIGARVGQGVGAAIATPSVMALIATNFAEGDARNRALAIYSAVSGIGGALGLLLGGVLTSWASWRAVFFVNLPAGIAIIALAPRFLAEPERHRGRLDVPGALTSGLGVAALVYAFIRAAATSWGDTATVVSFAVGVVLLAAFVLAERRAVQPTVPLRLFGDVRRSGAWICQLLLYAAMFGVFFFLTQYFQETMDLSAILAGLAFLPLSLGLFVMIRFTPKLIARFGPRPLLIVGCVLIAGASLWLTRLTPGSGYLSSVLVPMLLFGLGTGCCFMPLNTIILSAVAREDSGAASGVSQTIMWLGGAIGTAVLVTIFGIATRNASGLPGAVLTHGITSAFTGVAIFALCALAIVLALIRQRAPRRV